MEQVLISLIDSVKDDALPIPGIADQFAALKAASLKHHPEMKDDFDAQLAVEKEGSRDDVSQMQKQLAQLRPAVSRFTSDGLLELSYYHMLMRDLRLQQSDADHRPVDAKSAQ